MFSEIQQLKRKLQPHSPDNKDAVQYSYHFWTELEKLAKKNRKASLDEVKRVAKTDTKPGVIVRGALYQTSLFISKPRQTFDKEMFIDLIREAFPEIPAHKLRELATASVVDGSRTKTYTVDGVSKDD